jgi:large subunit ribosomal protein L30
MGKKLAIKQVQSKIGTKPKQQATLWSLGLRKMNSERIHEDNPVTRGMIDKVKHLVEVREIKE